MLTAPAPAPFNCRPLTHGFDTSDSTFAHIRISSEGVENWFICDSQPCPNASELNSILRPIEIFGGQGHFYLPLDHESVPKRQPSAPPAMTTPMTTEQLVHALATQVRALTTALQGTPTTTPPKSSMNKPDLFEGQNSTEARRFLAQFMAWASEQPDLKNDEQKSIKAALGYLTKKAANWAVPYLSEFNMGGVPFNGKWDEFVEAFKLRFESLDPGLEARDAIMTLKQEKGQRVAEFSQIFKDVGGRTGLSDMDLLNRFNANLRPEIRQNLVLVNIAQGLAKILDEAIKRAISIDTYLSDPTL